MSVRQSSMLRQGWSWEVQLAWNPKDKAWLASHMPDTQHRLILVDLRSILLSQSAIPALFPIYRVYPLKKIIETILLVDKFQDYKELVLYEISKALGHQSSDLNNTEIDFSVVELLIDTMMEQLDERILTAVGDRADLDWYVFSHWLDHDTIALKPVDK